MEEHEIPEFESLHNLDYDDMQEHVIDGDHELHLIDTILFDFFQAKKEKEAVSQ